MSGELFKDLQERLFYSPDFAEMRLFEDILLLVYDNLQKYGAHHSLLDGAKYVGKGITIPSKFNMKTGLDYPVAFDQPDDKFAHGAIKGECYLISPQHLLAIDKHQCNNSFMQRRFVKVGLLDQPNNEALKKAGKGYLGYVWAECLMYVGVKSMFADILLKNKAARTYPNPNNTFTSKPHYEWDPWEADWDRHVGHGSISYDPDDVQEDMFGAARMFNH